MSTLPCLCLNLGRAFLSLPSETISTLQRHCCAKSRTFSSIPKPWSRHTAPYPSRKEIPGSRWQFPVSPLRRRKTFADVIEADVPWHKPEATRSLLAMMSKKTTREKVDAAKRVGGKVVGTVYRRTRRDETGKKIQRAEVRFDDIAGCLRTPGGGSSRQSIVVVENARFAPVCYLNVKQHALWGFLTGIYCQKNYNDAYHLMGDGVAAGRTSPRAVHSRATDFGRANSDREPA